MNAKEYNKYLTALQEELGIHIISVRNNTSVEDCHKSLAEIGKYLNDKNNKNYDDIMKGYREVARELSKANFDLIKENSLLKLEVEKLEQEKTKNIDEIVEVRTKELNLEIRNLCQEGIELKNKILNLKNKLEVKKIETETVESFYKGKLIEKKRCIEILVGALILSNGYWIARGIIGWL